MALTYFFWIDYVIFSVIIALGCIIGIYFGFYKKQNTAEGYLLGGRNMKWFPISMSLVASAFTGSSLLGLPTEIYLYGTQVSMLMLSVVASGVVNYFLILPVFCKLQLSSVYQYLELRFNRYVRNTMSFLFIATDIFILPFFMYVPSLIFSQVSGVNLHVIAPIMIFLCTFYTCVGGMKAVVWVDTLQLAVTLITLTTVITLGVISIGGIDVIIDRARQGDRIEFFNFDIDPTIRSTFWTVFIGHTFSWTGLVSLSAPEVQRFLALPSKAHVNRVLVIFTVVSVVTKIVCIMLGLTMYAKYYDCDPHSIGEIKKRDQIVPYFITEVTKGITGLNGLFVAAYFGAAFSTFSTILNTLAGVIYTDFAHFFVPIKYLKEKPGMILKMFTLFIGFSSIGLIYLLEHVGTVFEIIHYIKGTTGGAVLGIYLMGLLIPFCNIKGVIAGGVSSSILMAVIIIKTQVYIWNGAIVQKTKPLYTYGCTITNQTDNLLSFTTPSTATIPEEPMWLFRLSFQYYYFIGTMVTMIIGILVSWFTKKDTDVKVNSDYISPVVQSISCKWRQKTTVFQTEAEPLNEKAVIGEISKP